MTLEELHQIKDFPAIFSDPRLKAALQYLRENPNPKSNKTISDATTIIRSEGAWHGWFEALEELERLSRPPVRLPTSERGRPYQAPVQPQTTQS